MKFALATDSTVELDLVRLLAGLYATAPFIQFEAFLEKLEIKGDV